MLSHKKYIKTKQYNPRLNSNVSCSKFYFSFRKEIEVMQHIKFLKLLDITYLVQDEIPGKIAKCIF